MKIKTLLIVNMFIALAVGTVAFARSVYYRPFLVAETIYYEARGEGHIGMQAVATVIYNRAKLSGQSYEYEVMKPYQFSCWNKGVKRSKPRGAAWEYAKFLQLQMENKQFEPLDTSWTHYYAPRLCKPTWAAKLNEPKDIGNHRFGELK